jgi:hypothetical protein
MCLGLKKVVLAAALMVMPLQGVAATFTAQFCHGDTQKHAMHANGGHDGGTHQHGSQDASETDGGSVFHSCHNTVTAPLFVALLPSVPETPVRALAPDLLHDLFVPDRPQRPPLA